MMILTIILGKFLSRPFTGANGHLFNGDLVRHFFEHAVNMPQKFRLGGNYKQICPDNSSRFQIHECMSKIS